MTSKPPRSLRLQHSLLTPMALEDKRCTRQASPPSEIPGSAPSQVDGMPKPSLEDIGVWLMCLSFLPPNTGPVHTYPDIFESATFSFWIQKFPRPHVANSPRAAYGIRIHSRAFLSPEAPLLLVSTKNHDLWPVATRAKGATLENRDSRTSHHSAHAQSQV